MRKVLFISLGCDKNLADSEEMLGMLVENGYEITNEESEAEVIVINTCAFIHDAKDVWLSAIRRRSQKRFRKWMLYWEPEAGTSLSRLLTKYLREKNIWIFRVLTVFHGQQGKG